METVFYLMMIPGLIISPGNSKKDQALQHATLAYYKQSGIEKKVKRLEKEHVPKGVKDAGALITWGVTVYETKMITYGWEF